MRRNEGKIEETEKERDRGRNGVRMREIGKEGKREKKKETEKERESEIRGKEKDRFIYICKKRVGERKGREGERTRE
jgi:hypothetical protein